MGVGEKRRGLNPVERSKSIKIWPKRVRACAFIRLQFGQKIFREKLRGLRDNFEGGY